MPVRPARFPHRGPAAADAFERLASHLAANGVTLNADLICSRSEWLRPSIPRRNASSTALGPMPCWPASIAAGSRCVKSHEA